MKKKDPDDVLRYDRMVERALRGVVQELIQEVIDYGLVDDHHFYITFLTDYPGVSIPEYLKERYPGEMTIVLQYQFHDLEVDEKNLRVTLSFNNVPERLVIPLPAITIFADPSVNFALQFQPVDQDLGDGPDDDGPRGKDEDKDKSSKEKGEVVSLDQFRKK